MINVLFIELCYIFYFVAFFGDAAFLAAGFGFVAFFAAAGFFVAVDLGFFAVVAFLTFGLAAFFVVAFLTPPDLVAPVFFALACAGFFVAPADFGVELDRGLTILTFFVALAAAGAAAADVAVVAAGVAAELVLAAVATFLTDFVPADFERARFFVPVDAVDDVFLV